MFTFQSGSRSRSLGACLVWWQHEGAQRAWGDCRYHRECLLPPYTSALGIKRRISWVQLQGKSYWTFERERVGGVFEGHTAQVTRVEWRYAGEDANSIFLSAALDDTIRVWYIDKTVPIAVLKLTEEVSGGYLDACWCPWYGNLLAGVHGEGVHLWDISLSTHAPILSKHVPGATCVAFSPHTRNMMVGDKDGQVSVFHLEGLELSANVFLRYSTKISKLAKIGVIPVN